MRGNSIRTLMGVILFVSAAWADDVDSAPRLLADDIDSYLASQPRAPVDLLTDEDRSLHAVFSGSEPDWFIVTAGVWVASLTGPIKFDGGTVLDVSETFGLDSNTAVPFVRFGLRLWRFEVILEGWWYSSDGVAVVDEEFEIDGVVFEVDDVIESRITLSTYRLALGYELWRADVFSVSLLAGLTLVNTTGRVSATNATDKTATWNEWIPVPAIGLNFTGTIWRGLIYEVEGNWIGLSKSAFTITAWDVRAGIGWQFNDWVMARVGYRYISLEGTVESIGVSLELDGIYVEIGLTF